MNKSEFKNGYYWLINDVDDPTLAYYYFPPDIGTWGFGFNTSDGGGFLPVDDLSSDTKVVPAVVLPPELPNPTPE